jgi:hypothetical protein
MPPKRQDLFFANSQLKIAGMPFDDNNVIQRLQDITNNIPDFISSDAWKDPYTDFINLKFSRENKGHSFRVGTKLQEHLLSAVNALDMCWIGPEAVDSAGYAMIGAGTHVSPHYKHRRAYSDTGHAITARILLSYLLGAEVAAALLSGKQIGHICDIRNCRNPTHLYICNIATNSNHRIGKKSNRDKFLRESRHFELPQGYDISNLDTILPLQFVKSF